MMMKDLKNGLLVAGAVMFSCTCSAAISDTFEGETLGWTGDGSIVEKAFTAPAVGLPIADTGTKVLEVQGVATRENPEGDTGNLGLIDFMLQVTAADESPVVDSGVATDDNSAGAPIAIAAGLAVDAKIPLMVLVNNAWAPLTSADYTEGEWVRVTIVVAYTAKRFRVSVNGVPVSTGYLEATGNTTGGPWFAFNKKESETTVSEMAKVSKVIVVGSTSLDDVVVAQGATLPEAPIAETAKATVNGKLVPMKYLNKYGVPPEKMAEVKLGQSTMTVMDKYEAGIDPTTAEVFKMTDLKPTAKDVFEIGVTGQAPNGYKVIVKKTDNTQVGEGQVSTAADGTGSKLTVTLPEGIASDDVLIFQVQAEAMSASDN